MKDLIGGRVPHPTQHTITPRKAHNSNKVTSQEWKGHLDIKSKSVSKRPNPEFNTQMPVLEEVGRERS